MKSACTILLGAALGLLVATATQAASYLPLSDADLARRAPVILRAVVAGSVTRSENAGGKDLPYTLTTLAPLEWLKGGGGAGPVAVRLPGGRVGDKALWLPGTPVFVPGQEVLVFLEPRAGSPGVYHVAELGLGHFDILTDGAGRRFAARPAFEPAEDLYLGALAAMPGASASGREAPLRRDADSLLESVRGIARSDAARDVILAVPAGDLGTGIAAKGLPALQPKWVNLGGTEPGSLFKWFWPSPSANGTVSTSGTQAVLSDGTDGTADVAAMVAQWHGVAASDVRYASGSGGNVVVSLGVASQPDGAWSTPLACTAGGVVGYGGPGLSSYQGAFKGDSTYYASTDGEVWIRQRTGLAGCYSATTFKNVVLHEVGHTLGLGHPDQEASSHSVLCPFNTCTAVMRSSVTGVTVPQADDIAGIQWYYGAVGGPCTYALSPPDLSNVAAAGTTASIAVTTPNGCPVPAATYQPWVTIAGNVTVGNVTTVQLQVSSNAGSPPRATAVKIADRLFLVTQLGP